MNFPVPDLTMSFSIYIDSAAVNAPVTSIPAWRNPSGSSPEATAPRSPSVTTPRAPSTRSPTMNPLFEEAATAVVTSNAPSDPLTLMPAIAESSAPSVSDSIEKTSAPTSAPVMSTSSPTAKPSTGATALVTGAPTASLPPSDGLTGAPSIAPTVKPTIVETDSPSQTITSNPSLTLSMSPTSEPLSSLVIVVMLLSNTNGTLVGKTAIDFVAATEAHIEQSIQNSNISKQLQLLTVEAIIDDQRVVIPSNSRRLQEIAPLQVAFTVLLGFQLNSTEYNTSEWIKDAFNSNSDRAAYIDRLQKRNTEFNSVTRIDVKVNGEIPSDGESTGTIPPTEENDDGDDMFIWIIVGSAVGGSFVLLTLAVLLCKRGTPEPKSPQFSANKSSYGPTSADETTKMGYAAEINVDRQDDISTLGDPVFGGNVGGMLIDDMEQRDEYTASVGPDYDYSKHYLGVSANGSVGAHTSNNDAIDPSAMERFPFETTNSYNQNVLSVNSSGLEEDDASSEEQYNGVGAKRGHSNDTFQVEVPPGKLGMVIDTPNNGVPVVHAIKQDSVLCDRVQVGDRLVSVDGEDVTSMTAVQVSKLISLKSDQQRLLVFQSAREFKDSNSTGSLDHP